PHPLAEPRRDTPAEVLLVRWIREHGASDHHVEVSLCGRVDRKMKPLLRRNAAEQEHRPRVAPTDREELQIDAIWNDDRCNDGRARGALRFRDAHDVYAGAAWLELFGRIPIRPEVQRDYDRYTARG